MPITSGNIEYRLSGGASNADPLLSLGGVKSSQLMGSNLFDNVSGAEAAAGDTEYRCIYVHNAHATLTLVGAVLWLTANATQADGIDIGLEPGAVNATAQAAVANENTPPSGVSFSRPSTKGTGLVIGDIPAGQHKAFWIRRDINAGAAAANDGTTFRVEGDTAP